MHSASQPFAPHCFTQLNLPFVETPGLISRGRRVWWPAEDPPHCKRRPLNLASRVPGHALGSGTGPLARLGSRHTVLADGMAWRCNEDLQKRPWHIRIRSQVFSKHRTAKPVVVMEMAGPTEETRGNRGAKPPSRGRRPKIYAVRMAIVQCETSCRVEAVSV